MSEQGELFHVQQLDGAETITPAKPLARHNHPLSSKVAAKEIQPKLSKLKRMALDAARRWPESTTTELEERLGLRSRTLGRRLGELADAGIVLRWSERKCKITGKVATVWKVPDDRPPPNTAASTGDATRPADAV